MLDNFEVKMCELVDVEDSSKRRRRTRAHMMLSIMYNSWPYQSTPGDATATLPGGPASSRYPSRLGRICLAATAVAFVVGILVGLLIPSFVIPRTLAPVRHNPTTTTPIRNSHYNRTLDRYNVGTPALYNVSPQTRHLVLPVGFPTVSFVTKANVMPELLRQKLYGGDAAASEKVTVHESDSEYTEGVYWSAGAERLLPTGFVANDSISWRRYARKTPVVKMEEGCGRMQNRLLTYEDGTKTCCRYRQNTDQIQGELFSYYLGSLLGLRNLAPSSLALVKLSTPLFNKVQPQVNLAQWAEDRAVVLTRFVDKLVPAHIPAPLRTPARRLHPPDVAAATPDELVEFVQWSDLVVFDYLTANLDRVVNNLYNLQWNPSMMDSPAHNLAKDPETGLLVFFDNESGLLHGYRLLDKYEHYHLALLDVLCVFRKGTVEVIKKLQKDKNVGALLQAVFNEYDPEFKEILPTLPEKSVKILNERIDRVYDQITMCEREYPRQ